MDNKALPNFLGHSSNSLGEVQLLTSHLEEVSRLCYKYCSLIGLYGVGEFMGLVHDFGKLSDQFQNRIRGSNNKVDHCTSGGIFTKEVLSKIVENSVFSIMINCIESHHRGLKSGFVSNFNSFNGKYINEHPEINSSFLNYKDQFSSYFPLSTNVNNTVYGNNFEYMFMTRILLSCLVDADWTDTSNHYSKPHIPQKLNPQTLFDKIKKYRTSFSKSDMSDVRNELWEKCIDNSKKKRGIYKINAVTGSGKTISTMGFALNHASVHSMDRVIVVIPYLSIIEQTAAVYKKILGESIVFEHHSLSSNNEDNKLTRKLAENWEEPIVVTTNVQFFESLFGSKPGKLRKIHNISNSVIILDEFQSIPMELIIPTLASLNYLVENCNCSVLISTATQPPTSYYQKNGKEKWGEETKNFKNSHEINVFGRKRVKTFLNKDAINLEKVAKLINAHDQVLCIVNMRKQAMELAEMVDGSFHISTNQCPLHRRDVISEVKDKLKNGLPCRLVSTQCIEAGVDVDFPVVYRSAGPLPSVVQAAGRCNREGKLDCGRLEIFVLDDYKYPDPTYRNHSECFLKLFNGGEIDLDDQTAYDKYYQLVSDNSCIFPSDMVKSIYDIKDFEKVSYEYKLIDQDQVNVIVPYRMDGYHELTSTDVENVDRDWFKKAQLNSVSIPSKKVSDLLARGGEKIFECLDNWYRVDSSLYSNKTGYIW